MLLNTVMYDNSGRTRGSVQVTLDFAQNQWSVEKDVQRAWNAAGFSDAGPFDVKGSNFIEMCTLDRGKPKQTAVALYNVPTTAWGVGDTGTGRLVGSPAADFKGAGISWKFVGQEVSEVRSRMLTLLKIVPDSGLSSDQPLFKELTGFDTARLKKEYWDNVGSPDRNFTTCNAFLGRMAGKLGAKEHSWLGKGQLKLINADKDVPGSWVEPSSGLSPRPGDYYSVSEKQPGGWIQEFGHVGIVGRIDSDGTWTSVDSGQGGRKAGKDFIKWVNRGRFDPAKFRGWIDIDKYFGLSKK